ncbi:hypothetical protein ETB97_003779 [Aspergillus alliaceus]|uniref:Indoleamine 2,3-dioxygenase n=1 Tax=Petromyces alliaceus TaxID=209559 RepID=A0A8H6A0S3_PETAA|nr:hypothetical protein ETB97_003779 [Aspergillus burnettii]
MAELLASLEHYDISPESGFLPSRPPLEQLPDPYYGPWEATIVALPRFISDGSLRQRVHEMPVLSTELLLTEAERRRAYMILGYIINGFLFGSSPPPKRLPLSISQPTIELSAHFGLPPVPTYAGQVLWNYRRTEADSKPLPKSNAQPLVSFTGSPEEAGFFGVVFSIEASGVPLISILLEATEATFDQDTEQVIAYLQRATITLTDMTSILPRMYRDCSQDFFYHKLRPFLDGTDSLASVGLPDGVFFEEHSGGRYRKHCGPSNAQSSLFALIDIALGVKHDQEYCVKDNGDQQSTKGAYLKEMRLYMPRQHREFLAEVERMPNIRDFVRSRPEDVRLNSTYENCLTALLELRRAHIRMVARYVVVMAKHQQSPVMVKPDSKRGERNAAGATGTGGTNAMEFLKSVRDSVIQARDL